MAGMFNFKTSRTCPTTVPLWEQVIASARLEHRFAFRQTEKEKKKNQTLSALLKIGFLFRLKAINLGRGMTNPRNECLTISLGTHSALVYCTVILFRILINLNLEI